MKTWHKIVIGGLGALTPIIMNLLAVDLEALLVKVTLFALIGYILRGLVLFFLGGVIAYLHKDENNRLKIFELGIVAPALITALINAGNVQVPKATDQTHGSHTGSIISIPSAYAQPTQEEEIRTFSLPEETRAQQFWRGLTGSSPERAWYVIVGSHLKVEDAEKQAQQINQKNLGFTAEVYAPYGGNPYYGVVIGANLTHKEARELRQQAISAGFPKDPPMAPYLWRFPE